MSRNSAGTYTLPAGNPVVADTVIDPAWANSTLNDIADALTNSLDRQGRGGMQAALPVVDGTLAVPGLNFANDPNNGLHRIGADEWALVAGGVAIATLTNTQVATLKLVVDNLTVDGNSITATNTNGGVDINVNGTGMLKTNDATDEYDDTAGRVLKVGDFGWGSDDFTLVTLGSVDDLTTPALYYVADSVTGLPASEYFWVQTLGKQVSTFDYGLQVAYGETSSTSYFRMQVLGTWGSWIRVLTTEDVTTSATDTTAGRLLKVGDFGLGGSGNAITDFNDALPTGVFYVTGSSIPNAPVALSSSWTILALQGVNSNNALQLALDGIRGDLYQRARYSGVWTAWSQQYAQNTILGTVSQSAGVPTGAVIERGSNANGEYVKFADGTLICTFATGTINTSISTAFFGGFRSGGSTWTFPAAFSSGAVVTGSPVSSSSAFSVVAVSTAPTTASVFYFTAITSQIAADRTATLVAIGRWF